MICLFQTYIKKTQFFLVEKQIRSDSLENAGLSVKSIK
jgi:hypothetical protein